MNPFTAKLEYVSFALKMTTGERSNPTILQPPVHLFPGDNPPHFPISDRTEKRR